VRIALVSDKFYHICEFRLDGGRLYVVWYDNDKGKDGFVSAGDGKIASSAAEQQMRAFCLANSIPLMTEPLPVYDFDSIAAWCEHPAAETIDPVTFLDAWTMLEDAESLKLDVENPDDKATGRMDKAYHKLFYANNFPAVTPLGASYEPIWSQEEVSLLSRIYSSGIAELRTSFHSID
jgi:hypothetical protein